jgi:thymidylate synthase (FAD)
MKANLLGVTMPIKRHIGPEAAPSMETLIAYCARVSNPAGQMNTETNTKLIKYLIDNAHWSPMEMVSATIEVETTRDIARQLLRHRSFSFQEFSQRYANPEDMGDMFVEPRECRFQDTKNRQNSINLDPRDAQAMWTAEQWNTIQSRVMRESRHAYEWAIDHGIAKEQARVVLPEGLTKSRLYVNGTIRSWIHYCQLRTANGTQKEHMILANEIAKAICKAFPMDKYVDIQDI